MSQESLVVVSQESRGWCHIPLSTEDKSSVHFSGSHCPSGPSSASNNSQGVTIGLKKSYTPLSACNESCQSAAPPLNPLHRPPRTPPRRNTLLPRSSRVSPGSVDQPTLYNSSSVVSSIPLEGCSIRVWRMLSRYWRLPSRRYRMTWLNGQRRDVWRGVWRCWCGEW